jgi:acyl-CoA thioester hydrolase
MIGHPMPASFSIRVRVRYAECDMQGHVFNGHYLTWFDMAHTGLLTEALGRPYREIVASGIDVVVAESGVRYRSPAHFEDELEIRVVLDPLTDSSMTSRFTVQRGPELVAEGFLRHVCVDSETLAKRPWPSDAREALSGYVRPGSAASTVSDEVAEPARKAGRATVPLPQDPGHPEQRHESAGQQRQHGQQ